LRISEVAKAADVGVEPVRFYARKGLIAQPVRPADGGFRSYPEQVAVQIRFIRQAQELGFSLVEIEDLLSLKSEPDTDCSEVRRRALSKRDDVNLKIKRLRQIHSTLTKLIDACPGKGALESCSIIEALEPNLCPADDPKRTNGKQRYGSS
jgi:MerR family mercuric resistance operon transcriptional regulator